MLTVYAACGPYERRAVRNGLKLMFQTEKAQSCMQRGKKDVPYRKRRNPVRINEILAKRAGLGTKPARNNKIPAERAGLGVKPARNNKIPAKRAGQRNMKKLRPGKAKFFR